MFEHFLFICLLSLILSYHSLKSVKDDRQDIYWLWRCDQAVLLTGKSKNTAEWAQRLKSFSAELVDKDHEMFFLWQLSPTEKLQNIQEICLLNTVLIHEHVFLLSSIWKPEHSLYQQIIISPSGEHKVSSVQYFIRLY